MAAPSASSWQRLEELFAEAVELPADRRTAFVEQATAGDPELRRQLLGLLEHDTGAGERIHRAVRGVAKAAAAPIDWDGRRFGPYRIVREIARGGMGLVFQAVRDDDEYRKTVALKIAPWWRDLDLLRERFRHERQILAGLEHPNIARFLDGGTQDGIPYFAMEYVEGHPITEYAETHGLKLHERIDLFRQVCSAVQYAHQSLVVHRDLKPSNILVTEEGAPKLLDFGIAKLLTPSADDPVHSETGMAPWTPDYASPEQVRSGPITTRTDVYSLGLLLFELLTGARGQIADTSSPLGLDRSICEEETELASQRAVERGDQTLARQLRGDLDTIIATAIRKEPERRYGSATALSDDLGRYLKGKPVEARPGTLAYRAWKLVRRHRVAVAAAVLVACSITAGVTATVYQARRAERRFQQVRRLANSMMFDIHDRIQHLAGATEARKAIVSTALEYLENLSHDSSGDTSLVLEVAAAYERIGDVQGLLDESNLGDTQGAVTSYRHAEAILKTVKDRNEQSVRFREASVEWKLGLVLQVRGLAAAARDSYLRAEELVRRLVEERPQDQETLRLACGLYSDIANFAVSMRDTQRVEQATTEAMALARRLVTLDPSGRTSRASFTQAQSSLARAYLNNGQMEAAAQADRELVALREQMVREEPENVTYRRELMMSYSRLADILGSRMGENLGDFAGAEQVLEQAAETADWLVLRDSADRSARFDLAEIRLRSGLMVLRDLGRPDQALKLLEQTQALLAGLEKEDAANVLYRYKRLVVDYGIGQALAGMGRNPEAVRQLEGIRRGAASLSGGYYGAAARAARAQATLVLARLKARAGDPEAPVLADSVAADIAGSPRMFAVRWNEASACADLGRVYLLLARWEKAISWLAKSADIWSGLKIPSAMEERRKSELLSVQADLESARRKRN
jgi:tetratricopeptide (TPR) repeat protein